MKICKSLGQLAITTALALSLGGCLTESGTGSAEDGSASGTQNGISLTITSPIGAGSMDTTDTSVSLAGTASAESGIARISWENDRGGSGAASGNASWQAAGIALELGTNTITVTAEDAAGASHSRRIAVNRESGETGSTTLSWVAPTSRTDGAPLTNLGGYTIYYGRMSELYDYQIDVSNPGLLSYVVEGLVSGDWYFVLAAYDAEGIESDPSNEVLRRIS